MKASIFGSILISFVVTHRVWSNSGTRCSFCQSNSYNFITSKLKSVLPPKKVKRLKIEINNQSLKAISSDTQSVSFLRNFIGKNASTTILFAEQITPFLLHPFKHEGETFGGFSIRKKGTSLKHQEMTEVKKLFCEDINYVFNDLMKNCMFTPIFGLEFKKGAQTVQVLICLDCDVWRFVGQDLNKEEDFDMAHSLILNYLKRIFPSDAIVKQLH